MPRPRVGVLGATSFIGEFLFADLAAAENPIVAFSRQLFKSDPPEAEWVQIPDNLATVTVAGEIPFWVSLIPIWLLPQYFSLFHRLGIKRLVALSSTSRFTKVDSLYAEERALAQRLADAEESILGWGQNNGIQVVILQATMIYAAGRDENVSSIARFICKFGFFPVLGSAHGLRQPVHAQDVAFACHAALIKPQLQSSYILSGGETFSYRDMIRRIFLSLNKPVRIMTCPLWIFKVGVFAARFLGKKISYGIAERMNQNLAFDHKDATNSLDFMPRKFELQEFETSGHRCPVNNNKAT